MADHAANEPRDVTGGLQEALAEGSDRQGLGTSAVTYSVSLEEVMNSRVLLLGLGLLLLPPAVVSKGKPHPGTQQAIDRIDFLKSYRLTKDTWYREGAELTSAKLGTFAKGTIVTVTQVYAHPPEIAERELTERELSQGVRMRVIAGDGRYGWINEISKKKKANLEEVETEAVSSEDAGADIAVAPEGMNPALVVGAVIVGAIIAIGATFAMNKRDSDAPTATPATVPPLAPTGRLRLRLQLRSRRLSLSQIRKALCPV